MSGLYGALVTYACPVRSENYDQIGWAHRTIYRPSTILKAFQSFLSSVLFEQLPVNTRVAFAYRKGTSLRQAVEMHAENKALYQTDFSKFFHSIDSNLVRRTILSNRTPVQDIDVHLDRILELTTINGRLPIGFVTSPAISNACLKPFDDALEIECKARALTYSRYADDLAISARDHQSLHGMEPLVLELARSHINPDLSLNESKSKLTRKGERLSLLGFDILPNGRVTVSREVRHKVERLIHLFVTKRSTFDELYDGDTQKGLQQLGGLVSHIHSADPLYLAKLRRKYGATIIDAILHRSLADEYRPTLEDDSLESMKTGPARRGFRSPDGWAQCVATPLRELPMLGITPFGWVHTLVSLAGLLFGLPCLTHRMSPHEPHSYCSATAHY